MNTLKRPTKKVVKKKEAALQSERHCKSTKKLLSAILQHFKSNFAKVSLTIQIKYPASQQNYLSNSKQNTPKYFLILTTFSLRLIIVTRQQKPNVVLMKAVLTFLQ